MAKAISLLDQLWREPKARTMSLQELQEQLDQVKNRDPAIPLKGL